MGALAVLGALAALASNGSQERERSGPRNTGHGRPPRPGWRDPRGHQELYDALELADWAAIEKLAGDQKTDIRPIAQVLLAGHLFRLGETTQVEDLLRDALDSRVDLASHPYAVKRFDTSTTASVAVPIALGVSVTGNPLDREFLTLMLVEVLQDRGELREAVEFLRRLRSSAARSLSLCELLAEEGLVEEVLVESRGSTVGGLVGDALLVYQGWALRHSGRVDRAIEVLETAIERLPDGEARCVARLEFAMALAATGSSRRARRELKRVLQDDPTLLAARELLDSL